MFTDEKSVIRIDQINSKSNDVFEKEILRFINDRIKSVLRKVDPTHFKTLEEIRLRANKPLIIQNGNGDWMVENDGKLTNMEVCPLMVCQEDIVKSLELMSENSIYAYQDEIKNGFITLKGGHRVGLTGRVVLDGSQVKNIKDISGMNIRVAREVRGCSNKILPYIVSKRNEIYNTLIVSPPQCGKTTMLRDVAKVLSDGNINMNLKGVKVGIVDERSEIAACYKGVAQNMVGVRTDVMDGCPKALGMDLLLRSMSPQVIVTDEIGNEGDKEAVLRVVNAGVKIITTAHGYNISELKIRREVIGLIEQKVFERYIVLSNSKGPGTVAEIIDGMTMEVLIKDVS